MEENLKLKGEKVWKGMKMKMSRGPFFFFFFFFFFCACHFLKPKICLGNFGVYQNGNFGGKFSNLAHL